MPLTIPSLDDRTFDDLVREAMDMIPSHAPDWTDHNASDPGITLLELLAYLTEMLIYRVNQIGDSHLRVFTELLTGTPSDLDRPPREQLRDAVRKLRLPRACCYLRRF
jgi:predicted phage baseplate assembly protein